MNCTRLHLLLTATALMSLAAPAQIAFAHGVDISLTPKEAVEVTASFEGGGPMAEAQVSVFAPDEPTEPWLTGVTDDEGRYLFVPDPGRPGTWEVQVRQAGHGGIVRIEVSAEGAAEATAPGLTGAQKAVMALAVAWGFVGTALYFRRKAS